jgi:RluA family pseudouridine synthase
MFKKVPRKYHPPGFELLFEDKDIIVGNKAPGLLTVAANWNRTATVEAALNTYIRKGSAHSSKSIYVVHRLDQDTTGLLVFAKTEAAFNYLKSHWAEVSKTYLAIVHRHLKEKSGVVKSYLSEDEDYHVHSSASAEPVQGATHDSRLAETAYEVERETPKFSLVRLSLITGRKNQIRVHMAEIGHPVVGDKKYGPKEVVNRNLMLHAWKLEFAHPFTKKRLTFEVQPPRYFQALLETAKPEDKTKR